jgi:hypothetical protein
MNRFLAIFVCAAAVAALGTTSCHGQGDGGGGGTACDGFVGKLRGCGLLSAGSFDCEVSAREGACVEQCIANYGCAQLENAFCTENSPLLREIALCAEDCEEQFRCGSGETFSASFQCDGYADCSDGSDEAGCPTYACADGEKVHAGARCTGYEDCRDGSDEAGCPTFTCADGDTVPESYACDGIEDCSGGEDEQNCASRPERDEAELTCPNGYDPESATSPVTGPATRLLTAPRTTAPRTTAPRTTAP